jgi:NAD(P)-dependent dehydrogenase (short-subunit alcohol dehydrogenase family)
MIFNEAMLRYVEETGGFGVGQEPLLPIPPVEPEAVSDAIVYLCGPSGKYVTGVMLPVEGGLALR